MTHNVSAPPPRRKGRSHEELPELPRYSRKRRHSSYSHKRSFSNFDESRVSYNQPKEHRVPLKQQYITLIKSGKKTIEGRVYTRMFQPIKVGDLIKFHNSREEVTCKVVAIKIYLSFAAMLADTSISKLLPDRRLTQEEAVKLYHSFPRYEENAKKFGVAAFYLEKI